MAQRRFELIALAAAAALSFAGPMLAQQPQRPSAAAVAANYVRRPSPSGGQVARPGDWAPEFLYGMLTSPNPMAQEDLERAAFAAGPAIIPQLVAALQDDRTAAFSAREIAYLGGDRALAILAALLKDRRNLDLRRFYYGALGEMDDARATDILLDQIAHSDAEPDREVTQAAILALTVHSEPSVIPRLESLKSKVHDFVIQDDLDNAMDILRIRGRAKASPEWKNSGASVEETIRSYFLPALEPPPGTSAADQRELPHVEVKTENLVFSPDHSRALARVSFEIPTAAATYDMVLQKKNGDWTLASVWLRNEAERPSATPPAQHY